MTGKATLTVLSRMSCVAAAVLLAGCSGPQAGSGPGWTAQPDASGSAASGAATASPGAAGSTPASASATATEPQAAATASSWKTYSDPAKAVSFDLPQDWIAQSVAPEEGVLPGALRVEVKKPDGTFVAALRTGLPSSSTDCPDNARHPYTVISSVPFDLARPRRGGNHPAADGLPGDPGLPLLRLLRHHQPGGRN
ncbi:hypothetical protein QF050_002414 [Arthrobacter sp. SLBN-112]|nr:hypothetical protein [Arthrobacter sp. SLBN-112]MDQ0800775.1 hypothetical protein [Arthrobacter sp. SLBN-112]